MKIASQQKFDSVIQCENVGIDFKNLNGMIFAILGEIETAFYFESREFYYLEYILFRILILTILYRILLFRILLFCILCRIFYRILLFRIFNI